MTKTAAARSRRGVHGKASAGKSGPALRPAPRAPAAFCGAGTWSIMWQSEVEFLRGAAMVEDASQSARAAAPARMGERTMFVSAIEDIISIGTGKSGLNAI